jgi:hypothetical protein
MSEIRRIVDPGNVLPEIDLSPQNTNKWNGVLRREDLSIRSGEQQIGTCTLSLHTFNGYPKAHFDGVEIREDLRGRGFGMATYLRAAEFALAHGYNFETQDYTQTAGSKKVWERLAALGVAEVIEPFRPATGRDAGKFFGKYRIPAR